MRPFLIFGPLTGLYMIQAGVDALTLLNLAWIHETGAPPNLYDSGVRYKREARFPGTIRRKEEWLTIPFVLERGEADCEDMASYIAAAAIARGIRARALVVEVDGGYHVVVRYPDGTVEDPSARLGMLDGPKRT